MESRPINSVPYQTGLEAREIEKPEVYQMLVIDVMEYVQMEWGSPIVFVPRKPCAFRFCIDNRKPNAMLIWDLYPIPRTDECIDSLGDAAIFSALCTTVNVTKLQGPIRILTRLCLRLITAFFAFHAYTIDEKKPQERFKEQWMYYLRKFRNCFPCIITSRWYRNIFPNARRTYWPHLTSFDATKGRRGDLGPEDLRVFYQLRWLSRSCYSLSADQSIEMQYWHQSRASELQNHDGTRFLLEFLWPLPAFWAKPGPCFRSIEQEASWRSTADIWGTNWRRNIRLGNAKRKIGGIPCSGVSKFARRLHGLHWRMQHAD